MYATRSLSTTFDAEVLEFSSLKTPISEDIVAIRELG